MENVLDMQKPNSAMKIKVLLERRPDGGMRAWSDDLPGFVLSHKNSEAVLGDVEPALEGILSERFCSNVTVELLVALKSITDAEHEILDEMINGHQEKEYVARCA